MFIYLVFIHLFAGDASAKDIDTAMKLGAGKKRPLSIIPTVDADYSRSYPDIFLIMSSLVKFVSIINAPFPSVQWKRSSSPIKSKLYSNVKGLDCSRMRKNNQYPTIKTRRPVFITQRFLGKFKRAFAIIGTWDDMVLRILLVLYCNNLGLFICLYYPWT